MAMNSIWCERARMQCNGRRRSSRRAREREQSEASVSESVERCISPWARPVGLLGDAGTGCSALSYCCCYAPFAFIFTMKMKCTDLAWLAGSLGTPYLLGSRSRSKHSGGMWTILDLPNWFRLEWDLKMEQAYFDLRGLAAPNSDLNKISKLWTSKLAADWTRCAHI